MSSEPNTQVTIEQRWLQSRTDAPSSPIRPADWILELGEDRALLHPAEGRWRLFDPVHGEWIDAGFGPGEAILLTAGGVTGAKRVETRGSALAEKIADLGDWCLLLTGGELTGPNRLSEVPVPDDESTLCWSPRFSRWVSMNEIRKKPAASPTIEPRALNGNQGFCQGCGTPFHPGDRFCRNCGKAKP